MERFNIVVWSPYYIEVQLHQDIMYARLAQPDWSEARAVFQPLESKYKLGVLVLQYSDLDSETITHEAYHVIEEAKLRRIRKFTDPHDAEEFWARRIEKVAGRINRKLDDLGG